MVGTHKSPELWEGTYNSYNWSDIQCALWFFQYCSENNVEKIAIGKNYNIEQYTDQVVIIIKCCLYHHFKTRCCCTSSTNHKKECLLWAWRVWHSPGWAMEMGFFCLENAFQWLNKACVQPKIEIVDLQACLGGQLAHVAVGRPVVAAHGAVVEGADHVALLHLS